MPFYTYDYASKMRRSMRRFLFFFMMNASFWIHDGPPLLTLPLFRLSTNGAERLKGPGDKVCREQGRREGGA